jgi:hypothetical protein
MSMQFSGELTGIEKRRNALENMIKQQQDKENKQDAGLLRNQPAEDQLDTLSGRDRMVSVKNNLRSRVALMEAARADSVAAGDSAPVAPLPPLAGTVSATGQAFGALATELPFKERAALAASFFQQVAQEVKENREAASSNTAAANANLVE